MMMKKYIVFTLLSAVLWYNAVAQTSAPEITRIIVNETGGVTLFWTPNTYTTDFDHSAVWYQQSYLSGFNKIPDSENADYTVSDYEHTKAQANNRQTSYYITNYTDNMDSLQSEPVNAIYLTACFSSEKIQLTWNKIHHSWTELFYIYRKAGTDSEWEFVASTNNTTYQDSPVVDYRDHSYKVYYKDTTDATYSVSNATNPISFSDHHPVAPSITSIAIEPNGATAIEWEKSPSTNVVTYIIYLQKLSGGWEELGKTNSPDTLYWLDQQTTLNDCTQLRTYAIAAVDNCGETSANYPDSSKSTLILYPPEFNVCNKEVKLRWQPCENMTVTHYEIHISDNNGNIFVKKLPATETEYSYTDFQTGNYCFKMNAIHERKTDEKPQTITSCQYCIDVYISQEPDACFFRSVSVNKDNTIKINFEVDTAAIAPKYQIERSETGFDDSYDIIATLQPTGAAVISFTDADPTLKTQNTSYHYLLHTLDSCGTAYPAKKPAQSILLTSSEDENHHAILEWNTYDGFLSELDRYIIHRYVNNEFDNTFSVMISATYFVDTDILLSDQTLSFDYRVAAVSRLMNENKRDTAFSNMARMKRLRNDIWFPNAFSPSGSNKIFRPVYSGLDVDTYEFTIFNRFGSAIYQTTEHGGGWNGKINGVTATSEGYGYMLKIKLKNGDRIERRGSMLLIN